MTHKMIFGECDACATKNRVLHLCEAYGIETAACAICRGGDLSDDLDDLEAEIEALQSEAESGEQWAHICALEAALVEARNNSTKLTANSALGHRS
jgi:hypothetical protein